MLDLIQKRRSCRTFTEQPAFSDDITNILKAGLWAPTSKNSRPCEFIVVGDRAKIEQLAKCKPHGAAFLAGAPLAIVVLADPHKSDVWIEDCSIAATLMQMTAEDLGLGSTWIQVRLRNYDDTLAAAAYIRQLLNVPEYLEIASILAIGYKGKERLPNTEESLLWEKVRRV
ncbi:MAG: nitroreductase family protein [Cytophagaceae bacterium]|nr:nitroreductase family protein [Cytophagaceae bacterium]